MKNQVQTIAWGWNTSISETTSVSPFEVMTGCKPINSIERLLKTVPSEIDVPATQTAAEKYIELARKHANEERSRTAEYLNQRGRSTTPLEVGDLVRIFIPPKGSEVEASNRKNKHKSHWSEILKVKQKLSQTTFKIESLDGTKCYSRTRTNIARASAIPTETNPKSIPSTPQTVPLNTLNINDIYLIKEQQTDTKHYI